MAGKHTQTDSEKSCLLNDQHTKSTKQQNNDPRVLLLRLEECHLDFKRQSEIDECAEGQFIHVHHSVDSLKGHYDTGSLPTFSISRFQSSIDIELDDPSSPNTTEWYGAVQLPPSIRLQRLILGRYDTLYVAES